MVGKAIFDGELLECYFSKPMYKMMIGEDLAFDDMEDLDNEYFTNLKKTLEADVTHFGLYFAITQDFYGKIEQIDLMEDGQNVPVTNENKNQYIEKLLYYKMYSSIRQQIDAFLGGFHELIPKELVSIFNFKELELLIAGCPEYDILDLTKYTDLHGYTKSSPQVVWMFEILDEWATLEVDKNGQEVQKGKMELAQFF